MLLSTVIIEREKERKKRESTGDIDKGKVK